MALRKDSIDALREQCCQSNRSQIGTLPRHVESSDDQALLFELNIICNRIYDQRMNKPSFEVEDILLSAHSLLESHGAFEFIKTA